MYVHYGRHICSETYTTDVKYIYTSVSGHIVDYGELIWGLYTEIVASYVHMN